MTTLRRRLRRRLAPAYRWLRGRLLDGNAWLRLRAGQDRVALASYPRSGNTWLRAMIEEATGRSSGSVYRDKTLRRGVEGVVVKTHELDAHRYSQAIHLVRHPLDAIYSHYKWKRGVAGLAEVQWSDHVDRSVRHWRAHARHWSEFEGERLLVRFEDMKAAPGEELRRVLRWLGEAADPEAVARAVEATQLPKMRASAPSEVAEEFFRQGETGDGREAFSEDRRAEVERQLRPWLKEFGYEE